MHRQKMFSGQRGRERDDSCECHDYRRRSILQLRESETGCVCGRQQAGENRKRVFLQGRSAKNMCSQRCLGDSEMRVPVMRKSGRGGLRGGEQAGDTLIRRVLVLQPSCENQFSGWTRENRRRLFQGKRAGRGHPSCQHERSRRSGVP